MSPSSPGLFKISIVQGVSVPKFDKLFIKIFKINDFSNDEVKKLQYNCNNYLINLLNIVSEVSIIGVTQSSVSIQSNIPNIVSIWSSSRNPYIENACFKPILLQFNGPINSSIINYPHLIMCPCLNEKCLIAYYCGSNIQNIAVMILASPISNHHSTYPINLIINFLTTMSLLSNLIVNYSIFSNTNQIPVRKIPVLAYQKLHLGGSSSIVFLI